MVALALLGGPPVTTERPPRWPDVDASDLGAVTEQLLHGELSAYEVESGPLFEFEAELRARFDSPHALLVSSGTAALQSAIFGLGLGPGDEVVVPAITFPGTASVPLHFGVTVRFVDVDPDTGNPSVEQLRDTINERTRAVIVAHAWGLPANLPQIIPYLRQRGIALVEDAARAFGTRCMGRELVTLGVTGCLSFHELKAVPAGEGGLFLTSDRRIYERAVALGHYYRSKHPLHLSLPDMMSYRDSGLGLNLKIHPLAAMLARSQLARLDTRLQAQARNHAAFSAAVATLPEFEMQQTPPWAERVSRYGFNVHRRPSSGAAAPSMATIVEALRAEGIYASTSGSPPLYQLPLFRHPDRAGLPGKVAGTRDDADFPGATAHASSLLRFPTLYADTEPWVERYIEALAKLSDNNEALARWERTKR